MKLGFFITNQYLPGESFSQKIQDSAEQVRAARQAGFDMICTGQHYLASPYQMSSTFPLLARLSAEAGETMLSSGDRLLLKLEQWQFSLAETPAGAKVFLRLKNIEQTDGAQLSDMRLLFEISGRTVHYGRLLPQLRPNESFEISNIKLIVDDADIPLEGWLSLGSEIGLSGQLKTEPKHLEILASLFGALLHGNPLDQGLSRAGLTIIADENAVLD